MAGFLSFRSAGRCAFEGRFAAEQRSGGGAYAFDIFRVHLKFSV